MAQHVARKLLFAGIARHFGRGRELDDATRPKPRQRVKRQRRSGVVSFIHDDDQSMQSQDIHQRTGPRAVVRWAVDARQVGVH